MMRPAFIALLLALAVAAPAWSQVPDAADAGVDLSAADAGAAASNDPLAGLPAAAPIALKAALEKAEVGLAEPFGFSIEVKHAAGESYQLPAIIEWGAFSPRSQKLETVGDDPKTTRIRFELQAFDVGEREVPGISLLVNTSMGPHRLDIPPQKVTVTGAIDPSQGDPKLREDRRPLPRRYRTVLWPLWVLLGLLAAAALAWWLWKRRKAKELAQMAKPRPPPVEEALERLAALEAENLLSKGEKQAYHFRLSEIVRDYLGRRFGFDSLDLTSDELLAALRRRSTPGLEMDLLAHFLSSGDLVKFARIEPTDGQCKEAMEHARRFVQRTVPVVVSPTTEVAS